MLTSNTQGGDMHLYNRPRVTLYESLLAWDIDTLEQRYLSLEKSSLVDLAIEINHFLTKIWGKEKVREFMMEDFDSDQSFESLHLPKEPFKINRKRHLALIPGPGYLLLDLNSLQRVVGVQLAILFQTKDQVVSVSVQTSQGVKKVKDSNH